MFRACLPTTYYHTLRGISVAMMPQSSSTAPYFSTLQTVFLASGSLKSMRKRQSFLVHPLMAQLQTCNSPTDILAVLRNQVQQFEKSTFGDDKLTKWLHLTVNMFYAFSSAIGAGLGLVNFIQTMFSRVIIFLGIPTGVLHLCRCRCPPFGYRHGTSFLGKLEVAPLLLERALDINSKDRDERTPLHSASSSGTELIACYLTVARTRISRRRLDGLHCIWHQLEAKRRAYACCSIVTQTPTPRTRTKGPRRI